MIRATNVCQIGWVLELRDRKTSQNRPFARDFDLVTCVTTTCEASHCGE
jgi:hypothetical protein